MSDYDFDVDTAKMWENMENCKHGIFHDLLNDSAKIWKGFVNFKNNKNIDVTKMWENLKHSEPEIFRAWEIHHLFI